MKTKVLFSALCLLVSISVCAGSKNTAKNGSTTKQTKVVQVEDGNVVVVKTTESTGKERTTSVTVTRNDNENGKKVYVVKSDGEATIATSLEADVKPELPVLAPDSMPEFPGGMSAMMTYLMDNVKYPADAKKDKKEGRVACSFVITKEGKVTDAHVVKSSGTESLDNEALRVVNNMPDWKPGKENGEPVNVHYTIPVVFKLK
jgi:protein TonB